MRLGEPARMQAAINITPLVDVVLVLLIIFMVMAPQMRKGPDVNLPNTTKPNAQGDERGRILVSPRCGGRRDEPQDRDPGRCKAEFPRGS